MATRFQTGAGDKIKLYVSTLPLGSRVEPTDSSTLSPAADVAVNATAFALDSAATVVIPGGTPLPFTTAPVGTNLGFAATLYVAKDIPVGTTQVFCSPVKLSAAMTAAGFTVVPAAATGKFTAKTRLLGGTSTGLNIGADRTSSLVFEDALGYEDGIITSQSWDIPWTANLLADDLGYRRVLYAATNAIEGREVFVWTEEAPPAGSTSGDQYKGATVVTSSSKDFPSEGILTFSCTFSGQGSPTYTPAVF